MDDKNRDHASINVNNLTRVPSHDLVEFIKSHLFDSIDDDTKINVSLVDSDKRVNWVQYEEIGCEGNPISKQKVIDTPQDFFINAQCHPSQPLDALIESICHTVQDLCKTWNLGVAHPTHYLTFRSPHHVLKSPSGSIQLTFLCSLYTDLKKRTLFLKLD